MRFLSTLLQAAALFGAVAFALANVNTVALDRHMSAALNRTM